VYNFSLNFNVNWKLRHFRDAKIRTYTLNGTWFKSKDETTNLGEYNFTQNTSLDLQAY